MGNIVEDAAASAHGVLYRIKPHDFARLTNMEHEYRWVHRDFPHYLQGFCHAAATLLQQFREGLPGTLYSRTDSNGCACTCRPTEVVVAPYDGRPPVRAVAFVSAVEMQIREGLPPSGRCACHQHARDFYTLLLCLNHRDEITFQVQESCLQVPEAAADRRA